MSEHVGSKPVSDRAYQAGCRCAGCRAAHAKYARDRASGLIKARIPFGGPEDPRHGTLNGYSNHNCRCERCKQANAENQVRYNRGRGVKPMAETRKPLTGPDDPRHGSHAAYRKGCRCDKCCDWRRQDARDYRAKKRGESS